MGSVRFYRGAKDVSLDNVAIQDGAIFIVQRGDNTGDMYVDIDNAHRLHIVPDSPIITINTQWYNSHKTTLQPEVGKVYHIWDYESETIEENGETITKYTPGFKVGDGNAYLADLPIFYSVTQERKDFWDNKVTAYIGSEPGSERLVLSKD